MPYYLITSPHNLAYFPLGIKLTGYGSIGFNAIPELDLELWAVPSSEVFAAYSSGVIDGVIVENSSDRDDILELLGSDVMSLTPIEIGASAQSFVSSRDDSIVGTMSGDILALRAGDDFVNSSGGDDRVDGGKGRDTIYGGEGNDVLIGGRGADSLNGGNGNDAIWAGSGDVGADILFGGHGNDTLGGGAGNDTISGHAGDNLIFGGSGDDSILGGTGSDAIWSGSGNDSVDAWSGHNTIGGGVGNDTINGAGGRDLIYGGAGDDSISGDTLYGGEGNDTLSAGWSGGALFGGDGDDLIIIPGGGASYEIGGFETRGDNTIGLNSYTLGFDEFSDLQMQQSGADVVIDLPFDGSITLWNTSLSQITADDFLFF